MVSTTGRLPITSVPRPAGVGLVIFLTIACGLWVDRMIGIAGQIVVTFAVWGVLTFLCLWLPRTLSHRLIACVWISGLGEIAASLAWGLYDYQFGNVPLFVPPGHALLYLMGLLLAERMSAGLAVAIPVVAAPAVAWLAWSGQDGLSLILYGLFVMFMIFGTQRKLYATMFVIALAMEIYGTALGNWTWRTVVPGTSITTLNPPIAAGVFYCALDWLVNRRFTLWPIPVRDKGRVP